MALMKCAECQRDISSYCEVCPHCGYPVKLNPIEQEKKAASQIDPSNRDTGTAYNRRKAKAWRIVGIACLVVSLVLMCAFMFDLWSQIHEMEKYMTRMENSFMRMDKLRQEMHEEIEDLQKFHYKRTVIPVVTDPIS